MRLRAAALIVAASAMPAAAQEADHLRFLTGCAALFDVLEPAPGEDETAKEFARLADSFADRATRLDGATRVTAWRAEARSAWLDRDDDRQARLDLGHALRDCTAAADGYADRDVTIRLE